MRGSPITSRIDYAVAVKKENSVRLIFAHKATSENILTAKITQTTVSTFPRLRLHPGDKDTAEFQVVLQGYCSVITLSQLN